MHYTISKPIFWTTTIISGLAISVWSLSGTYMGERMSIGGIIFYTVLFSPIYFGVGAVCGWLVAALYALLVRGQGVIKAPDVKSKSGDSVSRYTIAIMIGSCFATTVIMYIENHSHIIYDSVILLTWILTFLIVTLLTLGLMCVLKRTGKTKR